MTNTEMNDVELEELKKLILKKINEYKDDNPQNKTVKEQIYTDVNLEIAENLFSAAEKKAREFGVEVTVTVVNKGGNLIFLKKMDNAIIASIDVSYKKAYTALSLNCPSSKVDLIQFPGLDNLMKDKIVLFGGGYPIVYRNNLIGGIGVSGGNSSQDEEIAIYAIKNVIKEL